MTSTPPDLTELYQRMWAEYQASDERWASLGLVVDDLGRSLRLDALIEISKLARHLDTQEPTP